MIVIGIDPHKSTQTATAVDPDANRDIGSVRTRSSFEDYAQLITWSKAWPDRIRAVENASGLGHHLTQWLISRGEAVVDIPSAATARALELSRGGRRKIARIVPHFVGGIPSRRRGVRGVQPGRLPAGRPEGHTDVLRILLVLALVLVHAGNGVLRLPGWVVRLGSGCGSAASSK